MRIFVSINWPVKTIAYLEEWQQKLMESGVKAYWRLGQNLHLTLKFLGEVDVRQVFEVDQALKSLKGTKPFYLMFNGLGVFPNLKNPRILWVGIKSHELMVLQQNIEQTLEGVGFKREERLFRPHVTLASGGILGLSPEIMQSGQKILHREQITKFELMESIVERGIRCYKSIGEYKL